MVVPMTTVAEIMTREVKSLEASEPLLSAMQFLREHQVRHIPVLEGGALVGVLTDRDVKRATPSALDPSQREVWERIVKETPLSRVMTRDPVTATPATPFRDALQRFVDDRIGCLPVVDGGSLVGIVTARDLFRAMLKQLG
jgi:CBS domain-containing protein